MTLQMPPSFNTGPSLGSQLGEKLGMGISTGLQGALSTFMEERKREKETEALKKTFDTLSPDSTFEDKFKTLLTAPGVGLETKKLALSNLVDYEKTQQVMKRQEMVDKQRAEAEERRTEAQGKRELQRERIKSEWESPEIKKYRENLGSREETATQIAPALENARQYRNDPSRFVPGTAAHKALGDLATRSFAFYKPLFGGRLTQREFVNSIANLAANKAFPGGYEQAMNLIESMVTQATNEADSFAGLIDEGLSPYQARRTTLKNMREHADQIVDILKKGSSQGKKESAIKKVPTGTKITKEQAQEFLMKANGDKEKARQLARQMGYEF